MQIEAPLTHEVDLLVVGATTGAVEAAVTAAQMISNGVVPTLLLPRSETAPPMTSPTTKLDQRRRPPPNFQRERAKASRTNGTKSVHRLNCQIEYPCPIPADQLLTVGWPISWLESGLACGVKC